MLLKTIIIDDSKVVLSVLSKYVQDTKELQLYGVYESATSAIKDGNLAQADIIFLDVEMPEITGIQLAKNLDLKTDLVFISQSKEYAVDAFNMNATDYLHKPISYDRFLESVNRVRSKGVREDASNSEWLFLRAGGSWCKVLFSDINHIKANNNTVLIYTREGSKEYNIKLGELQNKLPHEFIKVHRSYIINQNSIVEVDREFVRVGSKSVPVSRTYVDELFNRINISQT